MPATMRWSRRNPCTCIELAAKSSASSPAPMSAASGPSLSSGGDVSIVAVGTHHTPARRSLPCSVSSSAVSSIDPSSSSIGSNVKRACPPRGFADRFASGDETAALHEVHHERHRLESQQQVLAPPVDLEQRFAEGRCRGGHGGLQRGEVERCEAGEDAPGELVGQALGVRLDLGHLRHGAAFTRRRFVRARWRTRRRAHRTPAVTRAASAGRRTAGCGRR